MGSEQGADVADGTRRMLLGTIALHSIPVAVLTAARYEVDSPKLASNRIVVPLARSLLPDAKRTYQLQDLSDRSASKETIERDYLWTTLI